MNQGFSICINQDDIQINSFIDEGYDNLKFSNQNVDFLFEGVLVNKKLLLQKFAAKDFQTLIETLYLDKKQNLIKLFEGEFRGYILDKNTDQLYLFTNHTATQRIFYFKNEDYFIADTQLVRLKNNLDKRNIACKPNIAGLYELLTFMVMLHNTTPLENVFKIPDGSYAVYEKGKLGITSYYDLNAVQSYSKNKETALKEIHEIFSEAMRLEYEKDDELGGNHFSNLSGGLDCRVSMFYAMQNGFHPDKVFCFSQKNYTDEKISRAMAKDYNIPYEFTNFGNFDLLKNVDRLTQKNEGTCFYMGAIHADYGYSQIDKTNIKLVHTGQIGGAILGSYNKSEKDDKNILRHLPSLSTNARLLAQTEASVGGIAYEYRDYPTFMLKNFGFGYSVNGSLILSDFAYQVSGFMHSEFMKLVTSLPAEWKYYSKFYIDWLNAYCPEATKYTWERTFLKPDAHWKTFVGDHVVRRAKNIFYNKILGKQHLFSMVPYQYYFDQRTELQQFYENYYVDNISRIDAYSDLQKEVDLLFRENDVVKKSLALNVLSIFKLYF